MSEFKIKHIGIRTDSGEEAMEIASLLAALFDLPGTRDTEVAVGAGDLFEVMKSSYRGERGHVAMQTDDVEKAMAALREKGIGFDESSIRKNEEGRISFVYLKKEIAGFQFHLTL